MRRAQRSRVITTARAALLSLGASFTSSCNAFDDPPDRTLVLMSAMATPGLTTPNIRCHDLTVNSRNTRQLGSRGDDLWMREVATAAGMEVEVGSGQETLENRFYGRSFVSEHGRDRFEITTRTGAAATFTYWGGDDCESVVPMVD